MSGYPSGQVTLWEDFLVDNVTKFTETVGSSAVQDVISEHGGWWRQTLDGGDADDLLIVGELAWEVDEGQPLTFETRHKSSVITSQGLWAGMTDATTEGSGINPIHDEGGTLVTTASDAVGFLLDESTAGTQDTTWQAVGVQGDTDNSQVSLTSGAAIVAATPQVLRMILTAANSGTARFYIGTSTQYGGGSLVSTQTSFFRSSVVLAPSLGADDRATATTVDWDYVYVTAPR